MKIVIGLVGPIASGKGTISDFLVSKGFKYYSLSNVVRAETTARGLELNRKNLQDVGNDLRENFGGTVLVDRLADEIRRQDFIVIDGVRNPQEIITIKDEFGGKIVHVSAYKNRRVERTQRIYLRSAFSYSDASVCLPGGSEKRQFRARDGAMLIGDESLPTAQR